MLGLIASLATQRVALFALLGLWLFPFHDPGFFLQMLNFNILKLMPGGNTPRKL